METTQRRRILRAMAESLSEKGYAETSVADVIKRAGVSRETFYQLYASKADCFLAAFEDRRSSVVRSMLDTPPDGAPLERFGELLGRYLAELGTDAATARLFLVEVYAAGPDVARRRVALQREFVDGIAAIFRVRSKRDRFACEALVAAIVGLITNALLEERPLADLRTPLVALAARIFGD